MTTLAETILRDVPRYWQASNRSLQPATDGEWLSRADVLAALTAALDGVDERAGEVLSRLRKADEYEPLGHDGWEAADLITALLAQNAWLKANVEAGDLVNGLEKNRADAAETEAEKLRGALDNIATELTGVIPEHDNMRMAIDTAVSVARAALTTEADNA